MTWHQWHHTAPRSRSTRRRSDWWRTNALSDQSSQRTGDPAPGAAAVTLRIAKTLLKKDLTRIERPRKQYEADPAGGCVRPRVPGRREPESGDVSIRSDLTGPALDARVVLGGFPMTLKRKGGLALLGFFFAIHSIAQNTAPAAKPAA